MDQPENREPASTTFGEVMERTIRSLFVAGLCIAALGVGTAQTKKRIAPTSPRVESWVEPNSFLGIELGKPLAEQTSVIVQCPTKPVSLGSSYTTLDRDYRGFCYEIPSVGGHKFRPMWNGPNIGVGYTPTLIIHDEVVQGVLVTTYLLGKEQFVALLKERYGAPHKTEVARYQNRMGATFTGAVLTWEGPKVFVEFSELGTKTDESSFQILLKTADAIQSETNKQKARQYKDKL
jgi:hypothetical protein